ncbi:hypothetical protein [Spiribacter roseus]
MKTFKFLVVLDGKGMHVNIQAANAADADKMVKAQYGAQNVKSGPMKA